MGLTHFPNGVSSFGMPVIGTSPIMTTGSIFFVDSGNTSAGGDAVNKGSDPSTPYLTIDYAVGKCTADKGDVIFVMPGHVEDLALGASIDADVAGISIIGLGVGPSRPRIDYNGNTALFIIGASGVTVANLTFRPSVTVVSNAISIEPSNTDTRLLDLEVIPGEDGAGVDEFLNAIVVRSGGHRTIVDGFRYSHHASVTGSQSAIHLVDASDRVHISNFWIEGSGAGWVAGIRGITTASTRILIENGMITCDDEPGIEFLTATTGSISNVTIFSDLANIDDSVVADGCAHFNVQYVDSATESGTLVKTESIDD